jgi:RNA polymerase sigma factor (sigma-70 family)
MRLIVYKICQKLVGPHDADDVCQHVALRLFERQKEFGDQQHPRAWVIRVARNACCDIFRRRKSSREEYFDDDSSTEIALSALAESAPRDPESALLTKEEDALLRTSVLMLPGRLREAATMHFLEELPHATIASRLAITEANVRKRIQLARTLLRAERHSGYVSVPRGERARKNEDLFATQEVRGTILEIFSSIGSQHRDA